MKSKTSEREATEGTQWKEQTQSKEFSRLVNDKLFYVAKSLDDSRKEIVDELIDYSTIVISPELERKIFLRKATGKLTDAYIQVKCRLQLINIFLLLRFNWHQLAKCLRCVM